MCQFTAWKLLDLYKVTHFRTYFLREREGTNKYIIYEHIPSPMVNCLSFHNCFDVTRNVIHKRKKKVFLFYFYVIVAAFSVVLHCCF